MGGSGKLEAAVIDRGVGQADVDKVDFTFTELVDRDDSTGFIADNGFCSGKTAQSNKRLGGGSLSFFRGKHVFKNFGIFAAFSPGTILDLNFSGNVHKLGGTKQFGHIFGGADFRRLGSTVNQNDQHTAVGNKSFHFADHILFPFAETEDLVEAVKIDDSRNFVEFFAGEADLKRFVFVPLGAEDGRIHQFAKPFRSQAVPYTDRFRGKHARCRNREQQNCQFFH